jgi:hypothetical protein
MPAVTEEQARTKTCPKSRSNPDARSTKCEASDCMGWRWADGPTVGPKIRTGYCGEAHYPEFTM